MISACCLLLNSAENSSGVSLTENCPTGLYCNPVASLYGFALHQIYEHIPIEAFAPEVTVEAFDICILGRFPKLYEPRFNVVLKEVKSLTDNDRVVIRCYHFRQSSIQSNMTKPWQPLRR